MWAPSVDASNPIPNLTDDLRSVYSILLVMARRLESACLCREEVDLDAAACGASMLVDFLPECDIGILREIINHDLKNVLGFFNGQFEMIGMGFPYGCFESGRGVNLVMPAYAAAIVAAIRGTDYFIDPSNTEALSANYQILTPQQFFDRYARHLYFFQNGANAKIDKVKLVRTPIGEDYISLNFIGLDDDFEIEFIFQEDVSFKVNPERLLLILLNMLKNAKEHGQATKMQLKIFHSGELVRIEISDNGLGVDLEDPEVIFGEYTCRPGKGGFGMSRARERLALTDNMLTVDPKGGLTSSVGEGNGVKFIIDCKSGASIIKEAANDDATQPPCVYSDCLGVL